MNRTYKKLTWTLNPVLLYPSPISLLQCRAKFKYAHWSCCLLCTGFLLFQWYLNCFHLVISHVCPLKTLLILCSCFLTPHGQVFKRLKSFLHGFPWQRLWGFQSAGMVGFLAATSEGVPTLLSVQKTLYKLLHSPGGPFIVCKLLVSVMSWHLPLCIQLWQAALGSGADIGHPAAVTPPGDILDGPWDQRHKIISPGPQSAKLWIGLDAIEGQKRSLWNFHSVMPECQPCAWYRTGAEKPRKVQKQNSSGKSTEAVVVGVAL